MFIDEYVAYKDVTAPCATITIHAGNKDYEQTIKISTTELMKALLDGHNFPVEEYAERIDNEFAFYIDEDILIKAPESVVVKYVEEHYQ